MSFLAFNRGVWLSKLDRRTTVTNIVVEFTALPFLGRFYRPFVRLLRIGCRREVSGGGRVKA